MSRLKLSIALLLIPALAAAACYAPEKAPEDGIFTITLHAGLDAEGRPTFGVEHDDVAVFPGERVRWECDCPGIDSFSVQDVQHLASIDELVDLFLEVEGRGGFEALRGLQFGFQEAAEADGGGGAAAESGAERARLRATLDSLMERLAASAENDPGEAFERIMPDELVPVGQSIESAPYREIDGNHVWKFTWVIRKGDQTERWDPHFSGHRRR